MVKVKKTVHMTEFPTKDLALFFIRLKSDGVPHSRIAYYLGVTVQKISAILRHAKK